MSASGYTKQFFRLLTSAVITTLSAALPLSTAKADIILVDHSTIQLDVATLKPMQELKIDNQKAKKPPKDAYARFAQESADNGAPSSISVLNTLGKDEKSVEYVQAKHFRYYVMLNIRENPSEMERITLSHQASGTQSRMLVMTK
jgi:hypothetical protein